MTGTSEDHRNFVSNRIDEEAGENNALGKRPNPETRRDTKRRLVEIELCAPTSSNSSRPLKAMPVVIRAKKQPQKGTDDAFSSHGFVMNQKILQ